MTQYSRHGSTKHKRIVDVATTHISDLEVAQIVPCDWCATDVRLIVYWALNTYLSLSHCAVTALLLRCMGLFPLILHPNCAATETMTLVVRPIILNSKSLEQSWLDEIRTDRGYSGIKS